MMHTITNAQPPRPAPLAVHRFPVLLYSPRGMSNYFSLSDRPTGRPAQIKTERHKHRARVADCLGSRTLLERFLAEWRRQHVARSKGRGASGAGYRPCSGTSPLKTCEGAKPPPYAGPLDGHEFADVSARLKKDPVTVKQWPSTSNGFQFYGWDVPRPEGKRKTSTLTVQELTNVLIRADSSD